MSRYLVPTGPLLLGLHIASAPLSGPAGAAHRGEGCGLGLMPRLRQNLQRVRVLCRREGAYTGAEARAGKAEDQVAAGGVDNRR